MCACRGRPPLCVRRRSASRISTGTLSGSVACSFTLAGVERSKLRTLFVSCSHNIVPLGTQAAAHVS